MGVLTEIQLNFVYITITVKKSRKSVRFLINHKEAKITLTYESD